MSETEKEMPTRQADDIHSAELSLDGSWVHAAKDGIQYSNAIPNLVQSPLSVRRRSFIDMANDDSLVLNDDAIATEVAPTVVPTLSNTKFEQKRLEGVKPLKVGKQVNINFAVRFLCIAAAIFSLRAFMHQHLKLVSLQDELSDMKVLNRALQSTSGVSYDNDVKLLLDEVEYQEEHTARLEKTLHETRTFLAMHMMRHYKSEVEDKSEDEKYLYALYYETGNRLAGLRLESDQAKRQNEIDLEDHHNDEEFLYSQVGRAAQDIKDLKVKIEEQLDDEKFLYEQYDIAVQRIFELDLEVEDKVDVADFLYSQYYKALHQNAELRKELEQAKKEHAFEFEDKNNDEEFLYEQYYQMKQELSKVKEENKLNNHHSEIITRDNAYLETKVRDHKLNVLNTEAAYKKLVLELAEMKKQNLSLRQLNFHLSHAPTSELKTQVETEYVDHEELALLFSQLQKSKDLAVNYKAQRHEAQTQMTALEQKYDELSNQTFDEEELTFVYSQLQQVFDVAMDLKTQLIDTRAQLVLLQSESEVLQGQYVNEELDFTYSQLHQMSDVAKKRQVQLDMTQSTLTALQQTNSNLVKHSETMQMLLHVSHIANQELNIEDDEIVYLYSQLQEVSSNAQMYKDQWEEAQIQLSAIQEQHQTAINNYDKEEMAFTYSNIQWNSQIAHENLHVMYSQVKVQKEQYEQITNHSLTLEMLLHFSYMVHQLRKADFDDMEEELAFVYSQISMTNSSTESCQEKLDDSQSKQS